MSDDNAWSVKFPVEGAKAAITIRGDVTYERVAKIASMLLEIADYLRPEATEPFSVTRLSDVDISGLYPLPEPGSAQSQEIIATILGAVEPPPEEDEDTDDTEQVPPTPLPAPPAPVVEVQAKKTKKPTRECPTCKAMVTINADGSMRMHGPRGDECPGENPVLEPVAPGSPLQVLAPADPEPDVPASLGEAATSEDARANELF